MSRYRPGLLTSSNGRFHSGSPRRSVSTVMGTHMRWKREITGSLTAIWPNGDEWTFSRPGGGYVYCDMGKIQASGTRGSQICYGGRLRGNTISERNAEDFEREVKQWLAAYRKEGKS